MSMLFKGMNEREILILGGVHHRLQRTKNDRHMERFSTCQDNIVYSMAPGTPDNSDTGYTFQSSMDMQ